MPRCGSASAPAACYVARFGQQFSGVTCRDPCTVTISGNPQSLSLAISMCTDIIKGTFKGFALLRSHTNPSVGTPRGGFPSQMIAQRPVYAPGYGLIPPSQVCLVKKARAEHHGTNVLAQRVESF